MGTSPFLSKIPVVRPMLADAVGRICWWLVVACNLLLIMAGPVRLFVTMFISYVFCGH